MIERWQNLSKNQKEVTGFEFECKNVKRNMANYKILYVP